MGRKKILKTRNLSISEKEKFYREHIGLVVFIAKKYIGRSPDLTLEDLIQEGILGLFAAAERFDHQKEYRFSTYATWWIRQAVTRALINKGRTICLPAHMIGHLNKYTKSEKKLKRKLNREPTEKEIAREMKVEIIRVQRIKKVFQFFPNIIPLNIMMGENEDTAFREFIEDKKIPSPVTTASNNILVEEIKNDLEVVLTTREEKIIKMRFGLENGMPYTLEEIGQKMDCSRERIRQIVRDALKRIRRHETLKLKEKKLKLKI